ncbi:glycosyltransferase [Marinitenerispora sediminis]|uniref:glycosyltransferase n=1 Tax=Marinitenerispora sediminis TaxID=1931232 RepID=UPI0015F19D06|nr:glycosyltransferase [Marinitenerispora sediminis]
MERTTTRIFRNAWEALAPPDLGTWEPRLSVSVVIPARGDQQELDLALAALAAQTYPAHLLEVVVVDDHSRAPLRLPARRPANCRVERAPLTGIGAGHARAYGAHVTSGEIICWLDPDVVTDPWHVEAHARWQHLHPECVTLGQVGFPVRRPRTPEEVVRLIGDGDLGESLGEARGHPWVRRVLERTDDLRDADHLGFHAHVGVSAALRRSLYEAAGGVDPSLTLGQDTEFGYRLWQAGGVFLPEPRARGWHVGVGSSARTRVPSPRFRHAVLADLMPHPRCFRDADGGGRGRRVPLVRVVVEVAGARYELVRACVDRVLDGTERDLAVTLVADWENAAGSDTADPADPRPDPRLELRLIQANYLGDPRVAFAPHAPRTGFPAPYLLELPVGVGVGPDTVGRLVARAERARAGLTELTVPDAGGMPGLRLWRTRALARALRVRGAHEPLADAVAEVHGRFRVEAAEQELTDLAALPVEELRVAVWSSADGADGSAGSAGAAGGTGEPDTRPEEADGAGTGRFRGLARAVGRALRPPRGRRRRGQGGTEEAAA